MKRGMRVFSFWLFGTTGLAIRSYMDPVRLLYLHDPTRTTIESEFYTYTIRPGPQSSPTFIPARSDLIRLGLAIRSDSDWRSGPTIIPASKTAKNSKRKQTVKRHFKPYLIPKLNKNELDNLDIQTKAQYKPSQQKYVP